MNGSRGYSVQVEGAKYGVSFGSALAMAISYNINHSILYAIHPRDLQLAVRRLLRPVLPVTVGEKHFTSPAAWDYISPFVRAAFDHRHCMCRVRPLGADAAPCSVRKRRSGERPPPIIAQALPVSECLGRQARVQGHRREFRPGHATGGLNETHVDHHRSGRCRSQLRVVPDAAWPAEIGSCPRLLRSDPRRGWHGSALPSSVGDPWASPANPTRPTVTQRTWTPKEKRAVFRLPSLSECPSTVSKMSAPISLRPLKVASSKVRKRFSASPLSRTSRR